MAVPTLMPKVPGAPDEIQRIKPEELKLLLDGGANLEVVDVQLAPDYANRHIPGATSLPWAEQIENPRALPKGKLLVIYCSRPNEEFAADIAMQLITKYGYTKIMLLAGGIKEWGEELDYPIERSFWD